MAGMPKADVRNRQILRQVVDRDLAVTGAVVAPDLGTVQAGRHLFADSGRLDHRSIPIVGSAWVSHVVLLAPPHAGGALGARSAARRGPDLAEGPAKPDHIREGNPPSAPARIGTLHVPGM